MNKRLFKKALAAVLTTALLLSGNGVAPYSVSAAEKVQVEGVYTNFQKATMVTGATKQIKAYVEPKNASDQDLLFTSSNEKVAKVTAKGLITAVAPGTATVTVRALDGSKQEEYVKIKVLNDLKLTKKNVDADNEIIVLDKTYGNVTIDASVGDAEIYLSGVTVKGMLTLAGGEDYTVNMYNTTAKEVVFDDAKTSATASLAVADNDNVPTLFLGNKAKVSELSARVSAAIKQGDGSAIDNLSFVQDDKGTIKVFLDGYQGTLSIDASLGNVELVASGCNLAEVAVKGSADAGSILFTNAGDSTINNLSMEGSAKVDLAIPANQVQIAATAAGASLTTKETVGTIKNAGTGSVINVASSVESIESSGSKATIDVNKGAAVITANLKGDATTLKGAGEVAEVSVNAANCEVNTANSLVTVGDVQGTKLQGKEVKPNSSATTETSSSGGGGGGGDVSSPGSKYKKGDVIVDNNFENGQNTLVITMGSGSVTSTVEDGGNGSSKALYVRNRGEAYHGVGYSFSSYLDQHVTVRVKFDIKCSVNATEADSYKATMKTTGILSSDYHSVASVTSGTADTWYTMEGTFNLVNGCTEAFLYIETPGKSSYYLDNVKITVDAVGDPIPVTGVSLDKHTLNLDTGASELLTATVSPDNADNKKVTWNSSDTSVVTVTDGAVKAIKAGTATITVTTEDGSRTDTCAVTVTSNVVLSLNYGSVLLQSIGATKTVTASVAGATWTTDNASVATVSDGVITAKGVGTATVTATMGSSSVTCNVVVSDNVIYYEDFEGANTLPIQADWACVPTLMEGEEDAFNGSGYLKVVNNYQYNGHLITLDNSEGYTEATFVINSYIKTAVAGNGVEYFHDDSKLGYTITKAVGSPTSWTKLQSSEIKVAPGSSIKVRIISSEDKATYFLDSFYITKTMAAPDGDYPITGITLNKNTLSLSEGSTEALVATVAPANTTTSKTVIWSSSNPSVASVNSSTGLVTAAASGSAIITAATTVEGVSTTEYTATCNVTVYSEPMMKFDRSNVVLSTTGSTLQLTSNKNNTTWSSSNTDVATVSEDGLVTSKANGTAIITGTSGSMTATCNVLVNTKALLVEDFEDGDLDEWIARYCTSTIEGSEQNTVAYDGDKCTKVTTDDVYNGLEYTLTNNSETEKQFVISAYVKKAGSGSISMVIKQEGESYTTYATNNNVGSEWVLLDNSTATKIIVPSHGSKVVRIKGTTATSFYVDNIVITDVTPDTPSTPTVETLTDDTPTYGIDYNGSSYETGLTIDEVTKVVAVSGGAITANHHKVASIYLGDSYVGKTVSVTAKVRRSGSNGHLAWQMWNNATSSGVNFAAQWGAEQDKWYTITAEATVEFTGELYLSSGDNVASTMYYISDLVITAR